MSDKKTIEVAEADYAALVEQNFLLRGCDIAYEQVWEKARDLQFSLDEACERIEQLERKSPLSKVTIIDHRETIKRPSIEPGLPPIAYCNGQHQEEGRKTDILIPDGPPNPSNSISLYNDGYEQCRWDTAKLNGLLQHGKGT